ncbi:unnamed protein product [Schistosoma bovis]|nr:unnamed protein product [Schistosoma bovis]
MRTLYDCPNFTLAFIQIFVDNIQYLVLYTANTQNSAICLLHVLILVCILTTYLISIHRGHVNAELPFISSTGAYPPESCIFGEGLNLAAFISLICSFFWYLIALERTKFMGIHQPKCVLNFMLLLSLVASIGLTLVGNFQQVNVELIHDIGAGMAFFGTTIYIILCALVSKRYLGTHWCIWAFRLLLGIMAGITSSFFSICHTVSRINFNGTQEESLTYRHPGQGIVRKHPSESDIYSLKS